MAALESAFRRQQGWFQLAKLQVHLRGVAHQARVVGTQRHGGIESFGLHALQYQFDALIEQLRSGRTLCSARTPLAVTMSSCGVEDVQRLRDLGIDHVLLRPFKVKAVLQALQMLSRARVDNAV